MNTDASIDLIWWITAVELPALGGLYWVVWRERRDGEETRSRLREALSAFKVEVARGYASIPALQDAERRLTRHLVRIENKLDGMQSGVANGGRS